MNSTPQSSNLYPSIAQSFGLVGVFTVISLILNLIFVFIFSKMGFSTNSPIILLVVFILSFLFTFAFAHFYSQSLGKSLYFPFKSFNLWLLPLLFVLTPSVGLLCDRIVEFLPEMPERLREAIQGAVQINFISAITVIIAAPLFEELLCRGIVLRGSLSFMRPSHAILFSAFIFALMHLNPWQGIVALIIGSLIGYVYWRTQSLLLCMYIHALNNGFAFLMLMYVDGDFDITASELFGCYYNYVLMGAMCCTLLGLYLLHMLLSDKKIKTQPD